VGVGTLRDDLLSLPGVEQAEIDGDPITPAGVRVRLSPGVDPAAIGDEIRRVLTMHGLRQEPDSVSAHVTPDVETANVELSRDAEDEERSRPEQELPYGEAVVPEPLASEEDGLDWVSVTEGRDGIVVTAASLTHEAAAFAAGPSEAAIDQAVVSAVAELAGTVSLPLIRSLDQRELAGTPVVTVVLEESGLRLVGSALVEGGRAYAVGRAVWMALSGR
jgi:hypothetical protein